MIVDAPSRRVGKGCPGWLSLRSYAAGYAGPSTLSWPVKLAGREDDDVARDDEGRTGGISGRRSCCRYQCCGGWSWAARGSDLVFLPAGRRGPNHNWSDVAKGEAARARGPIQPVRANGNATVL